MSTHRITIRVPEVLGERIRKRSRAKGQTESELVREALETYLGQSFAERPAYELAEDAGLIGCISRGRTAPPKDLSTNPRYFKGFGENGKRGK
jgi:predicted DNA-binding protein